MGQYGSSLRGVEYTQQVGLPTAEIDDIFRGDNEFDYAGDDQDFAAGYDTTAGQYFWRFPTVVAPNEPILNIFNGLIGETVTTPAAGVLANTENTIVIWGGTGAVASYTFIQGGIGVTSGTTRFRALANSLGVDIDINVVTPVIDIGADVFEAGTFIDIAYDTAETLTGALIGLNIDLATNVTGGSQVVTGMSIALPATAIGATSNAIDIVGPQTTTGLIDINPNGTATGDVINITPSAALTAGIIWTGIELDAGALDPLTGGQTIMYGANFNFSLVASADGNDASVVAFRAQLPRVDTDISSAFQFDMLELDVNGTHIGFHALSSIAASFTATYRGVFVEWNSVIRTANAPVLEGIRIDWPAATTSFGTSFPFILTDGTNTLMTITFATEIANLISLTPRGTITQNIIDITPAVAIAAGTEWRGFHIDGTALDPLTGANVIIYGTDFDFRGVLSADGDDADVIAHRVRLPTGDTRGSTAYEYRISEMTVDGGQVGFDARGASEVLSATANYRAFRVDFQGVTRDAGAPVIEGIRIDWPAATTSFGTSSPFILTDGTNTILTINSATEIATMFDMNPRTTAGSQVLIDIDHNGGALTDTFAILTFDWASAVTQAGAYAGIDIDFNTNHAGVTNQNVVGYTLTLPAFTQSAANTTQYIGYEISTAGALVQDTAAGTINHYGINLVAPQSTISFAASTITTTLLRVGTAGALAMSTAGTHNWYGSDIVVPQGTVTGTGTQTIVGHRLASSGNLSTTTAAGTINWRGLDLATSVGTVIANFAGSTIDWRAINIDMPDITQTAGTAIVDGLRIQTGAFTSGTARFWRLTDNAGAIMSDFIMNDGTITNATLRIYDSGGTDYISFFHDDTEAQLHATHGLFRFQDVADTDDSNALTINVSDALGGAGTEHVSMSIGAVEVIRLLDTGILAVNALDGGGDPATAEMTVFDLYDDLQLLESWAHNRLEDLPDSVISKNQNNNGYWLNQTNVNRLLRDTIRQIATKYEAEIQDLKTQLNHLKSSVL